MSQTVQGRTASGTSHGKWIRKQDRVTYADAGHAMLAEARAEEVARAIGVSIRRVYQMKNGDQSGLVRAVVDQYVALPHEAKAGLVAWMIRDMAEGMIEGVSPEALWYAIQRRETDAQGTLDLAMAQMVGRPLDLDAVKSTVPLALTHAIMLLLQMAAGMAVVEGGR